jgi:hypothetical protein
MFDDVSTLMLRQVVEACCSWDHGYLEIAVGIVLVVLGLWMLGSKI